jgi:hypothetical protein
VAALEEDVHLDRSLGTEEGADMWVDAERGVVGEPSAIGDHTADRAAPSREAFRGVGIARTLEHDAAGRPLPCEPEKVNNRPKCRRCPNGNDECGRNEYDDTPVRSPAPSVATWRLKRPTAILSRSRAVKHLGPSVGSRVGSTAQNVVPASYLILRRLDEPPEHGRNVVVVHRCTSVSAPLTFR